MVRFPPEDLRLTPHPLRLTPYASRLTCWGLQNSLKSAEPNQTHGFRVMMADSRYN
jgi:hypothetical protein